MLFSRTNFSMVNWGLGIVVLLCASVIEFLAHMQEIQFDFKQT